MKLTTFLSVATFTPVSALSGVATTTVRRSYYHHPCLFLPLLSSHERTKLTALFAASALLRRPNRRLRLWHLVLVALCVAARHRAGGVHGGGVAGDLRRGIDVRRIWMRQVLPADVDGVGAVRLVRDRRRQRPEHHRHGDESVSLQRESAVVS